MHIEGVYQQLVALSDLSVGHVKYFPKVMVSL